MPNEKNLLGKVIAGIVIALVTGYASYLFGKSTIKSQVIRDQRALAYAQFVDNKSLMERLEKANSDFIKNPEYIKARALYNSARFRVLIFGGKEVVQSLANYSYSTGDAFREATTRLFQAMRHDLLSESDHVSDMTIEKVLWEPMK
jgi:hypothetical protein